MTTDFVRLWVCLKLLGDTAGRNELICWMVSISFITNWHFPTKKKGPNLMGLLVNVLLHYLYQVRARWGKEDEGWMGTSSSLPAVYPVSTEGEQVDIIQCVWFMLFSIYNYVWSTVEKLYLLINVYITYKYSIWPFECMFDFDK